MSSANSENDKADVGILDARLVAEAADRTIESTIMPSTATDQNNDEEEDILAEDSSAQEGSEDRIIKEGDGIETTTRWDVFKALKDVEIPGDISSGGAAAELPSILGLQIGGVGISLPINDLQMPALKTQATPIVDGVSSPPLEKAVAYQIEADKIVIDNPKWNASLAKLLKRAATGLGIDSANVQKAQLQRLVIFEEGADCNEKKREDATSAADVDGRLASLVIQLPSRYTGGEYRVSYGEKGKEFKLGAGPSGDAPYGCYFVCYYDDCDVEIKPIQSGCRLELVYAIHYDMSSGSSSSIPNASRVCSTMTTLERSLTLLPRTDRVFLIPLDKRYNQYTLAKKGIDALQGKDRANTQAIKVAGGSWSGLKLYVVEAKRVDEKKGEGDSGYGYDYGGGYYSQLRKTTSKIMQIFGEDGKLDKALTEWARVFTSFESANKSSKGKKGKARGMMLAYEVGKVPNSDDVSDVDLDDGYDDGYYEHQENVYRVSDIWGKGKTDCAFEPYSGDPYDRETYKAHFLLALDTASKFEIECTKYIADDVVRKLSAAKDYDLLDRLVSLCQLKAVQSKLSPSSCLKLLEMIIGQQEGVPCVIDKTRTAYVKVILDNLEPKREPEQALYDMIDHACNVIDSRDLVDSVAKILEAETAEHQLYRVEQYLTRVDFVLRLRGVFGAEKTDSLLLLCCDGLAKLVKKQDRPKTGFIAKILESMIAQHGWDSMEDVVKGTVACLRASQNHNYGEESTDELLKRTSMLLELVSSNPCESLESLLRDAMKDVLSKLEKPDSTSAFGVSWSGDIGRTTTHYNIFSRPGSTVLLPALFKYGSVEEYYRLGQWAVKTSSNLDTLVNTVRQTSGAEDLDKDIVNKCLIQSNAAWAEVDKPILCKVLLSFPTIIFTKDKLGRLPIHCAAASNRTPVPSLMELFKAYPKGAVTADPVSGLVPFMLAGRAGNVDASFELLLADPSLIAITIADGAKKRKRNAL